MAKTPLYKIWIDGKPKSAGSEGARGNSPYRKSIQKAARKVVKAPWGSRRIHVEIWYSSDAHQRPDVDNIAKPILDALEGVVYKNDLQIRSVKIGCIPRDDAFKVGKERAEDFMRIMSHKKEEFLVYIYYGMSIFDGEKSNVVIYPRKMLTSKVIRKGAGLLIKSEQKKSRGSAVPPPPL